MHRRVISRDARERPLLLVRLQQSAQMQRRYVAQLPWWRHPLIGYLVSIPLTAISLLIPFAERSLIGQNYFLGAPSFLVTVLVALFWGGGPAVFSILLGIIALDYFFVSPVNALNLSSWQQFFPLIPYFLAELVVALITAQRESARRRALFAEQEVQLHIDELEEVNRQLEQTNHLKDVFVSSASHELKTPLTTIRAHAQIALRRLSKLASSQPEVDTARTSLEKIEEQTHRLQVLIDDLLDLGMLSAGKMKLRFKRCNLNDLCRDVIEDQRALTERQVELTLPSPPLVLRADCDRLAQVITNLLTNALKYSVDGSVVRIQLQKSSSEALLQVHNEGVPIPREQQEHLFEPFYRAPAAHSSAKQGWGLGLAICKDIVERHRGRIWVESSAESGTTFCVALPLD